MSIDLPSHRQNLTATHHHHTTKMRRTATYHRHHSADQAPPTQKTPSTGPSFPTPTTLLLLLSASVGIAALLYPPLRSTIVQTALCLTKSASSFLTSMVLKVVWRFVELINAGIFFAVFWASSVWAPLHYWVMDGAKAEWACGNKFRWCRAWD